MGATFYEEDGTLQVQNVVLIIMKCDFSAPGFLADSYKTKSEMEQ